MTLSSTSFRPPVRLSVAALAVAALGLSACGDGDSSSTGSAPEAAGLTLADVEDDGVLVVGTEGTYPPFTFHEGGNGELTGYDVEVAEAVGDQLGVEVQFEETQWDAIFAGLESGRLDAVANQVTITPERRQDYVFSAPYTVSRGVVVVNEGDTSISSIDDLAGKTTAQSLTSNWYEMAEGAGAEVENVEGWAQAVTLLQQGRVDATLNDQLTFLDYERSEGGDTGLDVAVVTDEVAKNAFAFRDGSGNLADAVTDALATLRKDGTLAEISERYFGEDVSS